MATPQKRGYSWKRIRYPPALNHSVAWAVAKRHDWEMLKQWAQQGLVRLKYLAVLIGGNFPRLGQQMNRAVLANGLLSTAMGDEVSKNRFDNALDVAGASTSLCCYFRANTLSENNSGVWEPGVQFNYALMIGTLKAPTYVQLMEWQATIAQQYLSRTGQITVIVQDTASVHRSQWAQQQVKQWQEQGLFLLFLLPHSPQM